MYGMACQLPIKPRWNAALRRLTVRASDGMKRTPAAQTGLTQTWGKSGEKLKVETTTELSSTPTKLTPDRGAERLTSER